MEEALRSLLSHRERKVITEEHLKPSAVLVPLFVKEGGYHMLFIKRSQKVEHHKGEISFPGGLSEYSDETVENTALREACEEVGINPQEVKVLGILDDMKTLSTHYRVTPVVGSIPYPYLFTIDSNEVDEIVEIPLSHLLDEANSAEEPITREGKTYTGWVYHYKHYIIWGATARILNDFLARWKSLRNSP